MDDRLEIPDERSPLPYFAGRDAELSAFERKLRRVCADGRSTSRVVLTTGVPGSGKTLLAFEFAERIGGRTFDGRTVAALMTSPESLASPVTLFKRITVVINAGEKGAEIAQIDDRTTDGTLGVAGVRAAVTRDAGRHTSDLEAPQCRGLAAPPLGPAPPPSMEQPPRSLRSRDGCSMEGLLDASRRQGLWHRNALVLLIDELQSVDDGGGRALRVLHQGLHGCPILLLGFGLQHTAANLVKVGISRIVPPRMLAPLNDRDTRAAFRENLRFFGHRDIPPRSMDALVEASHGFPQHVRGYIEGVDIALKQRQRLDGPALEAALRHGDQLRVAYYDQRLDARRSRNPLLALASIMRDSGRQTLDIDDAKAAVVAAGHDGQAVDAGIESGALKLLHGDVSFGIPSFHGYMLSLLCQREQGRTRPTQG